MSTTDTVSSVMSLSDVGQIAPGFSHTRSGPFGHSASDVQDFLNEYNLERDSQHRILTRNYRTPSVSGAWSQPSRSNTTSIMDNRSISYQPTVRTGSVPGLTNGGTSATDSSICTDDSSVLRDNPNVLQADQDGVLRRLSPERPRAVYPCSFYFLCCTDRFDDVGAWYTHCLSHFRGNEPPKIVQCPYCTTYGPYRFHDGREAWKSRMDHIINSHFRTGIPLSIVRPDFELFKHLWQKRIVNDAERQELNAYHTLSAAPNSYYTLTQGSSAEERRRSEQQRQRTRGDRRTGYYVTPRTLHE